MCGCVNDEEQKFRTRTLAQPRSVCTRQRCSFPALVGRGGILVFACSLSILLAVLSGVSEASVPTGFFVDTGQRLGTANSHDIAVGDLNGDGYVDVFVANGGPNTVWFNDGSGNFQDSGQALGTADSRSVVLADVDGNGTLDAIVANYGVSSKAWLNDGTGHFADSGQVLGQANSLGLLQAIWMPMAISIFLSQTMGNPTQYG